MGDHTDTKEQKMTKTRSLPKVRETVEITRDAFYPLTQKKGERVRVAHVNDDGSIEVRQGGGIRTYSARDYKRI